MKINPLNFERGLQSFSSHCRRSWLISIKTLSKVCYDLSFFVFVNNKWKRLTFFSRSVTVIASCCRSFIHQCHNEIESLYFFPLPIIEAVAIPTNDGWCTPNRQWARSLKELWPSPPTGIVHHIRWNSIGSCARWKINISGIFRTRLRLRRRIIFRHSQQGTVMHLITVHFSLTNIGHFAHLFFSVSF